MLNGKREVTDCTDLLPLSDWILSSQGKERGKKKRKENEKRKRREKEERGEK